MSYTALLVVCLAHSDVDATLVEAMKGWRRLATYYKFGIVRNKIVWGKGRLDVETEAKLNDNHFVLYYPSKNRPDTSETYILNDRYRAIIEQPRSGSPAIIGHERLGVPRSLEFMLRVRSRFGTPVAWAPFSVLGLSLIDLCDGGSLTARTATKQPDGTVELAFDHKITDLNHDWFSELKVVCDPNEEWKVIRFEAVNRTWTDGSGKRKPIRLLKRGVVSYSGATLDRIPLVKSVVVTAFSTKDEEFLDARADLISFEHRPLVESEFMLTAFGLPEINDEPRGASSRFSGWICVGIVSFIVLLLIRFRIGRLTKPNR